MRPLKYLSMMLAFGQGFHCSSASANPTQSIGFTQSSIGSREHSYDAVTNGTYSQSSQAIVYSVDHLYDGISLRTEFDRIQPDYSNYLIRSSSGMETPLTQGSQSSNEFNLKAGATRAWDTHQFTLDLAKTLNSSPFAITQAEVGWDESFFSATTHLGLSFLALRQNQPENTYIDRDQQQKNRPTQVHAYQLASFWDQALNARLKNRLLGSLAERVEERPLNWSLTNRTGYALRKNIFTQLELRRSQEFRGNLKNDRGYYDLWSAAVSFTFEPLFDFLITPSYGLVIEREDDPRISTRTQSGTDQYGVALEFPFQATRIQSSFVYERSNTRSNSTLFSAGLIWTL